PALFVDLVSGREQFARYREALHLGGLHVDDELKSGRLLDGQVARFLTLEYPGRIDTGQTGGIGNAAPITHQAAGRRVVAVVIDRGDRMLPRQRDELFVPAEKVWVGTDQERPGTLFKTREYRVQLAIGARVQSLDIHPAF